MGEPYIINKINRHCEERSDSLQGAQRSEAIPLIDLNNHLLGVTVHVNECAVERYSVKTSISQELIDELNRSEILIHKNTM